MHIHIRNTCKHTHCKARERAQPERHLFTLCRGYEGSGAAESSERNSDLSAVFAWTLKGKESE